MLINLINEFCVRSWWTSPKDNLHMFLTWYRKVRCDIATIFLKIYHTGKGWSKYFIHLLKILSCPRTYFWCNGVYNLDRYMVSWLCFGWAAPRPGEHFLVISTMLLSSIFWHKTYDWLVSYSFYLRSILAIVSWRKCCRAACGDYQGMTTNTRVICNLIYLVAVFKFHLAGSWDTNSRRNSMHESKLYRF